MGPGPLNLGNDPHLLWVLETLGSVCCCFHWGGSPVETQVGPAGRILPSRSTAAACMEARTATAAWEKPRNFVRCFHLQNTAQETRGYQAQPEKKRKRTYWAATNSSTQKRDEALKGGDFGCDHMSHPWLVLYSIGRAAHAEPLDRAWNICSADQPRTMVKTYLRVEHGSVDRVCLQLPAHVVQLCGRQLAVLMCYFRHGKPHMNMGSKNPTCLGPPVERLFSPFSEVYFSRGTLPQKG